LIFFKSDDSRSFTPPPASKGPIQISRKYSGTSSASDIDPKGKHSNNKNNNNKPQSDEDDFW
jgi:hypothetical protein